MRKMWLLGIAGVLVLVLGPMLVAYTADDGAPPKHEKKADGMKGERPPDIQLTPAQEDALGAEIMNFREALGKLQAKAETVLKDRDQARKFVMQTIIKEMRAAAAEGGKRKKADREQ